MDTVRTHECLVSNLLGEKNISRKRHGTSSSLGASTCSAKVSSFSLLGVAHKRKDTIHLRKEGTTVAGEERSTQMQQTDLSNERGRIFSIELASSESAKSKILTTVLVEAPSA